MNTTERAKEIVGILMEDIKREAAERRMNAERRIKRKKERENLEAVAAGLTNEEKLSHIIQRYGFESLKTISFARAIETGRKDVNRIYANLILSY